MNDSKMEAVVTRLAREERQHSRAYEEKGRVAGIKWAKTASFPDLEYVVAFEVILPDDEVVGKYLRSPLDEMQDPYLFYNGKGEPSLMLFAWQIGWHDGAREVWDTFQCLRNHLTADAA